MNKEKFPGTMKTFFPVIQSQEIKLLNSFYMVRVAPQRTALKYY